MGKTITLALTGENQKETSTFFRKDDIKVVGQIAYTDEEHTQAIDAAITELKLIKLTYTLAQHFARFRHPNSLETEVLPTIAMYLLESNFKEKFDVTNVSVQATTPFIV